MSFLYTLTGFILLLLIMTQYKSFKVNRLTDEIIQNRNHYLTHFVAKDLNNPIKKGFKPTREFLEYEVYVYNGGILVKDEFNDPLRDSFWLYRDELTRKLFKSVKLKSKIIAIRNNDGLLQIDYVNKHLGNTTFHFQAKTPIQINDYWPENETNNYLSQQLEKFT